MTTVAPIEFGTAKSSKPAVKFRSVDEIDVDFIERWCDLERRTLEGNAFLSPHFVMPAMRHLPEVDSQCVLIITVEDSADGRLLALGVFEDCSGSRLLPLKHLRNWRCDYSFFDGLLVDQRRAKESVSAFFEAIQKQGSRWHGVAFCDRSTDGPFARVLEESAACSGVSWHEEWQTERAMIPIDCVPAEPLQELFSKNRRKTIKRNRRRLEERGDVGFKLHRQATDELIDTFLDLEAKGWKGEQGSAMASSAGHAAFCREMAAGFGSHNQAVIAELTVDDQAVASSINLISGDTLFALKIGWDTDFAECSPGTQSEFGLLTSAQSELSGLKLVDSCSKPGSYVENVWPWKRLLTTGVFTTTMSGHLAARTMSGLKQVKRLLKKV